MAPDVQSPDEINLAEQLPTIIDYLSLSILDPASLHDDIYPASVTVLVSSSPSAAKSKGAKGAMVQSPFQLTSPKEDEKSSMDDRQTKEQHARYRIDGLAGLRYLLESLHEARHDMFLPDELRKLVHNPLLWTALSPLASADDSQRLGAQQPGVRQGAWSVLAALVAFYDAEVTAALHMLAEAVLSSCWHEADAGVWQVAGATLGRFLIGKSHRGPIPS